MFERWEPRKLIREIEWHLFTLILNYIINSLNYYEIMEVVVLSNCCLHPCIFLSAFSSWQICSLHS